MKTFLLIGAQLSRWIDAVAGTVRDILDQFHSPRTVKLLEDEAGEFVLQTDQERAGDSPIPDRIRIVDGLLDESVRAMLASHLSDSRVELTLQPSRFLFRPLELPSRATEFLGGVVRSQIDRLTPWAAADVAFGWSKPVAAGADRMAITIASTARAVLKPYVQAIASIGAVQCISIFTAPPDLGSVPIKVWEERAQRTLNISRIRKALVIVLTTAGVAAASSLAAAAIVGARLDAEHRDLAQKIAAARITAGGLRAAPSDSLVAVQHTLEMRKNNEPSAVMIIEALSRILPEHTYVTELRIEAGKLRLVGITLDAPSLIGLLEQAGPFAQATFFAPTTRSDAAPKEHFHIEAIIQPLASWRS
jgi:general secretion pathway protein L